MNNFKKLTFMLALALGATTNSASAADLWGVCTGCERTAAAFAAGIPGDRSGAHTVNIIDEADGQLRSFDVTVYFDYEFRAWTRFARPKTPSSAARETLTRTRDAVHFLESLPERLEQTTVDIADVQTFLGARGALDGNVNEALFRSLELSGVWQRLVNSSVELASNLGQLLRSNVNPKFRIHFNDGSSVLVSAEVIVNQISDLEISVVPGSARLPDGTELPHDSDAFDGFVAITRNAETARALADWAILVGGYRIHQQLNVPRGATYSYLFRCDANECVLTANLDQ
ncbi:MAG: hypothetical protein AAFU66_02300 [Pseudomonadota bacterium]